MVVYYHMVNKTCATCNTDFSTTRRTARFCSKVCNTKFHNDPANKSVCRQSEPFNCLVCGSPFVREWPRSNQLFCGRACALTDYTSRNRDKINKDSEQRRTGIDRPSVLAAKRKWNASESAKAKKAKWYEDNKTVVVQMFMDRYRSDPIVKKILQSRQNARRKLKRASIPMQCKSCGFMGKLHCHHINENPLDNALENLMWLCVPCHAAVHSETER